MATIRSLVNRARWLAQQAIPRTWRTTSTGFARTTREAIPAADFATVDSAHTIERRPPRTLGDAIDWEFTSRFRFLSPETFVATLPRGRVLEHGVMTRDGTLLADLSIEPGVIPENAQQHSLLRRRNVPPMSRVRGTIIVLSAYGGATNYFHWMFDVLPRIGTLRRSGHPVSAAMPVLVSGMMYPFQRETLAQIGISNVIDATAHPLVSADTLIVPSLPGIMGDVTAAACRFLRDEFLSQGDERPRTRLFISRSAARNRRLTNEAELIKLLEPLGFIVVRPERMSFREQVSLFRSAGVVIAPHGAGLSNIVFCSPGTRVVELFSPTYVNGCYWATANQVSLDYWYLLGEGVRPATDDTHSGGADDYRVDPAMFSALLIEAAITRTRNKG